MPRLWRGARRQMVEGNATGRVAWMALLTGLLVCSPTAGRPLAAQEPLRELVLEELPANIFVGDPETAVLVVESAVAPLSFESQEGIGEVREPERGVYQLFLSPGFHHLRIHAEGYLPLRMPRWNFAPRSGRRVWVNSLPRVEGEGTLIVESTPPGAQVTLNGVRLAAPTPVILSPQKTGGYWIGLSGVAGHDRLDSAAVVRPGQTTRLTVTLPRRIAGLQVNSDPPGAQVALDGERLGYTPLVRSDLRPGEQDLAVWLEGYEPHTQRVRFHTGETMVINAALVRRSGRLVVTTRPAGATVYVAEDSLGVYQDVPLERERLVPGIYRVRAVQAGYQESVDSVQVIAGQTVRVELALRPSPGALYVIASPVNGSLYLNDRPLGRKTPQRLDGLSPGSYRVRVKHEGFEDGDTTVTVAAERTQTVMVRLQRIAPAADCQAEERTFAARSSKTRWLAVLIIVYRGFRFVKMGP